MTGDVRGFFRRIVQEFSEGQVGQGESDSVGPSGYGSGTDAAMDLFRDWSAAQAHYAGIGPPGTAQARKRLAWESGTAMAQHFGWSLPNWWYDIPEKIDAGEI